jgi:hypothetical protein
MKPSYRTNYRTRYATRAEAIADGWRSLNRRTDRDISGGNFMGYLYQSPDGQQSTQVWFTEEKNRLGQPGCFAQMFRDEPTAMPDPVLTVEAMLAATLISNGIHRWAVEGGAIEVTTEQLRVALKDAYDPTMPDWPAMVQLDA